MRVAPIESGLGRQSTSGPGASTATPAPHLPGVVTRSHPRKGTRSAEPHLRHSRHDPLDRERYPVPALLRHRLTVAPRRRTRLSAALDADPGGNRIVPEPLPSWPTTADRCPSAPHRRMVAPSAHGGRSGLLIMVDVDVTPAAVAASACEVVLGHAAHRRCAGRARSRREASLARRTRWPAAGRTSRDGHIGATGHSTMQIRSRSGGGQHDRLRRRPVR
jgi:hypothetical protein